MALTEVDAARLNDNIFNTVGPFSNRIINGDMRIDQRNVGASVSVTDGTYTVDRFKYVGSSSRITAQRSTSSLPTGFDYALLLTSVGANTPSSEGNGIWQIIEANNVTDLAYGTANAKTTTLSFWVRSSAAATYGGAIQNANLNRSYPFSYTISAANTWEYKTITIPGDTSGTWNTTGTSGGLTIIFSVGASSGYKGTANTWAGADYRDATGTSNLQATNGATPSITGVQLEAGSVATPFERRSFGQELALTQRYYYRVRSNNDQTIGVGYNQNTSATRHMIFFPVTMRTSPTALEQSGTAADYSIYHGTSLTVCNAVPIFTNCTTHCAEVQAQATSSLTAGQGSLLSMKSTGFLAWSAEL